METVKKISTLEKIFIKFGKIVAVCGWNGGNVHEIDEAQSIKCRISALHYIDYTPAMWNVEEKICTLYIDTSYCDQGGVWAKNQVIGNDFHYSKIQSEKHFPVDGKHLVFLGDQTGIGHFCTLQQLATKNARITGFITFNDVPTLALFLRIVRGCLCSGFK